MSRENSSIWTNDQGMETLSEQERKAFEDPKNLDNESRDNVGAETEPVKEDYERMIKQMREQAGKVNNSREVQENGFAYPTEWIDAFEAKLKEVLDRGEKPDIGIVGYGSLQSDKDRSRTLKDTRKPGLVRVNGLRRGLYFSARLRPKDRWEKRGLDMYEEQAVMAIKYNPEDYINGVRIPLPGSKAEIAKLEQREKAYFLLPSPPAQATAGDSTFALNLVCWPMGRDLMDKERKEFMDRIQELNEAEFKMSTGSSDEKVVDDNGHPLGISDFGSDDEEIQKGHAYAYRSRLNGLYRLDGRPLPDMGYVHTCLDIGDGKMEEEFLRTTYCYDREGNEVTLFDYLKKYAPASNRKIRSY